MQCYVRNRTGHNTGNVIGLLGDVVSVCTTFLAEKMADKKTAFDFIIAGGMSGGLVASPVSIALGVPLIIARDTKLASAHREPLLPSNNCFNVFKPAKPPRIVFFDDTISYGRTRQSAQLALYKMTKQLVTHQFTYNDLGFRELTAEERDYVLENKTANAGRGIYERS